MPHMIGLGKLYHASSFQLNRKIHFASRKKHFCDTPKKPRSNSLLKHPLAIAWWFCLVALRFPAGVQTLRAKRLPGNRGLGGRNWMLGFLESHRWGKVIVNNWDLVAAKAPLRVSRHSALQR